MRVSEDLPDCDWFAARARAGEFVRELTPVEASLEESVGAVLAAPLTALSDMPAYDTSLFDGWAIAGPGPWRIRTANRKDLFAGLEYHESTTSRQLLDGQATPVTYGEALGQGVTGIVPNSRGRLDGDLLKLIDTPVSNQSIDPGSGVRPRASDASIGSVLLEAGERVTPAVAALAATAGHDVLRIFPMPAVALIRIGAEFLDRGVSRSGMTRDAVSPALPGWIAGFSARCQPPRWVTGSDAELIETIDDVISDIVITSGPASGAAIRRVLAGMRADILVDGVACNPGSSMLMAQLQDGRPLIHCGDIPADAIASLLTLLSPILANLTGMPDPARRSRMSVTVFGDRRRTTLIPVRPVGDRGQEVDLVRPGGPGGLFALARASAMAIIPPGGVRTNETVTILPMP